MGAASRRPVAAPMPRAPPVITATGRVVVVSHVCSPSLFCTCVGGGTHHGGTPDPPTGRPPTPNGFTRSFGTGTGSGRDGGHEIGDQIVQQASDPRRRRRGSPSTPLGQDADTAARRSSQDLGERRGHAGLGPVEADDVRVDGQQQRRLRRPAWLSAPAIRGATAATGLDSVCRVAAARARPSRCPRARSQEPTRAKAPGRSTRPVDHQRAQGGGADRQRPGKVLVLAAGAVGHRRGQPDLRPLTVQMGRKAGGDEGVGVERQVGSVLFGSNRSARAGCARPTDVGRRRSPSLTQLIGPSMVDPNHRQPRVASCAVRPAPRSKVGRGTEKATGVARRRHRAAGHLSSPHAAPLVGRQLGAPAARARTVRGGVRSLTPWSGPGTRRGRRGRYAGAGSTCARGRRASPPPPAGPLATWSRWSSGDGRRCAGPQQPPAGPERARRSRPPLPSTVTTAGAADSKDARGDRRGVGRVTEEAERSPGRDPGR